MGFTCGIIGLPNVGKSSLFNALAQKAQAEAANFPFCTIEPNIGDIPVPDIRLDTIAELAGSAKRSAALLRFVDVAGLVRGASTGEGLGNQFLSHVRDNDVLIHVVRCFTSRDITHVEGRIAPADDIAIIETELLLADLAQMEKRVPLLKKRASGQDKQAKLELAAAEPVLDALNKGVPVHQLARNTAQAVWHAQWRLLTDKPVIYVANASEPQARDTQEQSAIAQVDAHAKQMEAPLLVISVDLEAQLIDFSPTDREAYLRSADITETSLAQLIHTGYRQLSLCTFFTAGPKETKAWTIPVQCSAQAAAGKIHTDFVRGFIRAETIAYDDYVACAGEAGAKAAGKLRQEGKDYIVQDGDVILFRFNV